MLDRDQSIAILDMQGNTERKLMDAKSGSPIWNPSGDQFAVVRYAENRGQLVVFDDQDDPIWTSPDFEPYYVTSPEWSPDGNGLAWITTAEDKTKHWLHLVNWTDPKRTIHDIPLIEQSQDRPIAFSPDSQWLVTTCMDPQNIRTQAEVVAFHLPSLQTFRHMIQLDAVNARRVVWADDSHTFLAGGIMHVSSDEGLRRLGT